MTRETLAAPSRAIGDDQSAQSGFLHDLQTALRDHPHSISPKYFYDEVGSRLFDDICRLPEYYPTRIETTLLSAHASEMAELIGPGAEIIEFGAGSLTKIAILLERLESPRRFVPIDMSGDHLYSACARLKLRFQSLEIAPMVADYTGALDLPVQGNACAKRVGFFPGSTIGNLAPGEALEFLRHAANLLRGGALILGADLIKAPQLLHAAYNDAQGVTAAFNLNLLARANRELGADFVLANFSHSAFYNAPLQRVEMHLISRYTQQVKVGGESFTFAKGETLHTENSYKFTVEGVRQLAARAGFMPGPVWTDPAGLFSVHWLNAPPLNRVHR